MVEARKEDIGMEIRITTTRIGKRAKARESKFSNSLKEIMEVAKL